MALLTNRSLVEHESFASDRSASKDLRAFSAVVSDSSKAEVDRGRISLAKADSAMLHPEQSLGAASYVTGIHTVAELRQFE